MQLVRWKEIQDNVFYYGEVNKEGQKDERGIVVQKGQDLFMGLFKTDMRHGRFLQVNNAGVKVLATYLNDLVHGQVVWSSPDGVVETWEYEYVVPVEPKQIWRQETLLEKVIEWEYASY